MFDWKTTVQMLGRWQTGTMVLLHCLNVLLRKTGQVAILVRDVQGVGDNP